MPEETPAPAAAGAAAPAIAADAKPPAPPPEEFYEYETEVEEQGDDGKPVKKPVKEKLPKSKVNEILARRKRLDTESYRRLEDANKRSEKADQIEQRISRLKDNPLAWAELVREAGGDPVRAADEFARQYLAEQELSPEARAERDRTRALDDREKSVKQTEERIAAEQQKKLVDEWRHRAIAGVTSASAKVGLPKHPGALALINASCAAQVRLHGKDNPDFEPDYESAAEDAKDTLKDFSRSWLATLPYEALVQELPPEVVKTLRAGDLARAQRPPEKSGQAEGAPRTRQEQPKKFLNPDEWRKKLING